jgi:hypothetical protein
MAKDLGIKKGFFDKDHYDIPKRRMEEIMNKCIVVNRRNIARIARNPNKSTAAN